MTLFQGVVWTAVSAVLLIVLSVLLALMGYVGGDMPMMGLGAVCALAGLALAVLAWRAP